MDLQDSGTSHHQDDMKQSKTWWWKQIPRDCSNPPIRAFVLFDSFRMAGTPKFGWRFSDGFWVASFFFFSKMCFRKGWFFWDHSEWPKPGNLDDNQKLDPYIFCIWCYKYQLMVLMFLFDMDPSTSKHKEIEQFRILPFPAVWKIGRP